MWLRISWHCYLFCKLDDHHLSKEVHFPYQQSGLSVSLPAPSKTGIWKIYAIMSHSPIVYSNYLEWIKERNDKLFTKEIHEKYYPDPEAYKVYMTSYSNFIPIRSFQKLLIETQ